MRKYQLLYLLFSIMLLLQGCSNEKYKEMSTLTGTLVWSASYGTNSTKIYGSNLKESLSEPILYYSNDYYKRILFPSKSENSMLYVGIKETGENEIIEVVNGAATSLLKKEDDILFPVMLKSQSILYIGIDKAKKSYLGLYSSDENLDKVLEKENINIESKPSVSESDSILFVTEKEDAYCINLIDADGNTREVVNGRYPVWVENEKKFIYYYDKSIRLYDLSSNESQRIEKSIIIKGTPVISPDKKFVAFFQSDSVAFFGGETVDYLRVMPITGGKKSDISAFHMTRSTDSWGGLEWIE